jgi:hypothetical protein
MKREQRREKTIHLYVYMHIHTMRENRKKRHGRRIESN